MHYTAKVRQVPCHPLSSQQLGRKLLDYLIELARSSPVRPFSYGEVARTLDTDFNPRDRHHVKFINNLYGVNHYCFEHDMPLFGVLVVRASDGQQGDGFYVLARDIGLLHSEARGGAEVRDSQVAQTIEYARNSESETSVADRPSHHGAHLAGE